MLGVHTDPLLPLCSHNTSFTAGILAITGGPMGTRGNVTNSPTSGHLPTAVELVVSWILYREQGTTSPTDGGLAIQLYMWWSHE